MKRILMLSFAIASFSLAASAQIDRKGEFGGHDKMGAKHGKGDGMEIVHKLNLTDAQKNQLKAENESFRQKMTALRGNKTITVGDAEAQRKSLMDAHKANIDNILTAEQKAQLESRKAAAKQDMAKMHENRLQEMKTKLNLTDDQYNRMKALQESNKAKMESLHNNTALTADQKMEQMKTMRADQKTQLEAILTAEQVAKMKELRHDKMKAGDMKMKNKGDKKKIKVTA